MSLKKDFAPTPLQLISIRQRSAPAPSQREEHRSDSAPWSGASSTEPPLRSRSCPSLIRTKITKKIRERYIVGQLLMQKTIAMMSSHIEYRSIGVE